MKVLHQSHRQVPEVVLLQRLLNLRLAPSPALKEDGRFGPKTAKAVGDFQKQKHLTQDGRVGPRTWKALGLTIDISHPVQLFPQPTGMSCWSAAGTMLFGNMSVGPGAAALTAGGLSATPGNVRLFADSTGLTMHYPQTWTVQALAGLLKHHGPLWMAGAVPSLHAFVIGSIWGDGAPDGSGTALLIYDPWPPGVGKVYSVVYQDRLQQFQLGTLYVLHR